MVKMMNACLVLASIALAGAQTLSPGQVTVGPGGTQQHGAICAWHGIAVADQLMNSIIFIWQGTKRCGAGHKAAECSVDVSYAIEAVQNTINVMMSSINGCGSTLTPGGKCAIALGETTAAMAGVAGASSEIAEVCPRHDLQSVASRSQPFPHDLAMCIVDAKDLFWSVFRAGVWSADASEKCKGGASDECDDAILRATVAFASMGEFIAGVVGHCTQPDAPINHDAAKCSSAVLGLIHQLAKLSVGGHALSTACGLTDAQRLYLENGGHKGLANSKGNVPTLALALLPVTAVMSFVLGRRMSKARQPTLDEELGEEATSLTN